MVRVSTRKRRWSGLALAAAVLALAALLAACAAPTGAGLGSSQSSAPQAAAQSTPAQAPKQAAATTAPAAEQVAAAAAAVSFSKDVMPVFQQTCVKCHGGSDGTKGGLSLKTYDDVMQGGQDGPVINPSDANGSMLVKQIQSGKMPKRAPKLPQDQIGLIAKWVAEGAKNN